MAGQAGIYTLTVTDGNGCAQTDSQNIEVISFSLDTQSNPPDSEACEGANLVIKAITDAESATYSWQGPGGSASELDSISFAKALPGQSGIYHVTVTDANGCSQTASDTITIHRLPLAVIDSMPETGIVCEGEQLKFCARPDAQIVAYGWNGPDGFSSSGRCVDFTSSTQSQSGTYTLTVTDVNGCENSTDTSIQVAELPVLTVETAGAQVNAGATGGTEPYTFIIFGGNLEDTIILSEIGELTDGEYTIILTDANGCTDDVTFIITDIADPVAEWGLTLSPNPSPGLFEVAVGSDQGLPLKISIFDQTGRMLKTEVLRTRRSTLDLSASPAGLYLLRLFDGEKTGMAKVVVAR